MLEAMYELPPQVDIVEVRLDHMASYDLRRLCAARDRAIIVTNRPQRQGGHYRGPEDKRLAALVQAAEHGADYVDVELDSVHELGELPGECARIVSYHDLEGTPANLESILCRILATGAHVAKVVSTAQDITDVPPVLRLLERYARNRRVIALSMGETGLVSRILAAKLGAFLTFASRSVDRQSAPGQLPYQEMLGTYRLPHINAQTRIYGVVANPVAHSMSPAIHNAAFAEHGLNAVYLPFKVRQLDAFLAGFQPYDLCGLSVTIPHKQTILPLMDEVDEQATAIGAVNTVLIKDGRRYGSNTDVNAAVKAIRGAAARAGLLPLDRRTVLVVGAGGAARAIVYGLHAHVRKLVIANRTVSRAEELAKEFEVDFCGLDEMSAVEPDILVNTTSVGMWPRVGESPVPRGMLRHGMVVFDAVYNPLQTKLLREAREAGALTTSGLEWFMNQAVAQFELWTQQDARREVMESVVRKRLHGG